MKNIIFKDVFLYELYQDEIKIVINIKSKIKHERLNLKRPENISILSNISLKN